jgi:glycerol kinase
MSTILAIDQSTSATKAMLFDFQGNLLDKVSFFHEQIYPQPGWVEHNAEEIYQNTVSAIQKLLAQNQDCINDLIFLSITNQRETILVFDRQTGQPLRNAIVWQCRRGSDICAKLEPPRNPGKTKKWGCSYRHDRCILDLSLDRWERLCN